MLPLASHGSNLSANLHIKRLSSTSRQKLNGNAPDLERSFSIRLNMVELRSVYINPTTPCLRWDRLFTNPYKKPLVRGYYVKETSCYSANGDIGAKVPTEQSEIIFLGTGTSEGIPRVSCLTHPLKACAICSKAVVRGNKNRRLNTSILIRYPKSSGRCNILVDAGKYVEDAFLSTLIMFTYDGNHS
ncbi:hypothetical protein HHK36_021792 [Tetracentron sinense]|uniref:Uncharacterized protein n=1 Tax=Tetracentron sinense TaxID=13715 RepID=A0A834YVT5_TETSI|nr:hypothetical protein HHK36_021792 [Tetracentron sinense]